MSDGSEKVGFTQPGVSVDEERVVRGRRRFGYRQGRSMGEAVRGTDDEMIECEFLVGPHFVAYWRDNGVGPEVGCGYIELDFTPVGIDLHSDRDVGCSFVDRVLHQSEVTAFDAALLESVGYHQDELTFVEGNGTCSAEGRVPYCVTHLGPDAL